MPGGILVLQLYDEDETHIIMQRGRPLSGKSKQQ